MKAILVMNMPDTCKKCPCRQHDFTFDVNHDVQNIIMCGVRGYESKDPDKRPDWCPLKEEPFHINRLIPYGGNPDYAKGLKDGWNFCLNAIEGTED